MIRFALFLVAMLASGCAEAIFSIDSFRSHEAYSEASLLRFREIQSEGAVLTKADVLATLGPPVHVIGQDAGEIFVYRRMARDIRTINLNPGMVTLFVSLPAVPIYFDSETSGRDDTLMVFFDRQGNMRGEGVNLGVRETGQSGAALIGEGVQGLIQ